MVWDCAHRGPGTDNHSQSQWHGPSPTPSHPLPHPRAPAQPPGSHCAQGGGLTAEGGGDQQKQTCAEKEGAAGNTVQTQSLLPPTSCGPFPQK